MKSLTQIEHLNRQEKKDTYERLNLFLSSFETSSNRDTVPILAKIFVFLEHRHSDIKYLNWIYGLDMH